MANEQTTEGVYKQYFLGLWLCDKQPEKQLECKMLLRAMLELTNGSTVFNVQWTKTNDFKVADFMFKM